MTMPTFAAIFDAACSRRGAAGLDFRWAAETGRPLCQLSLILAFPVDG